MASSDGKSQTAIDPRLVRKLADILHATELTEIEVEHGELKIRVARKSGKPQMVMAPTAMPSAMPSPMPSLPEMPAAPAMPAADVGTPEAPVAEGDVVNSPMVGTAYLQPEPGSDPFVSVGDQVKEGQTLLIVEAMKTMNPIPAPKSGVIKEIMVGDAEPVEFGAPLMVIG